MSEKFESTSETGGPPNRRRWLRWARDLALLVLIVVTVQWWQSRHLIKDTAPPLVGLLVDGASYQLVPQNGPTLVHFWADWCPICRFEEGSIERIAQDHSAITIATSSGSAVEVQAYLDQQGLTMPVLIDEAGAIARGWGVYGVPATFIVDRHGQIVHASQGYSTELGLRLRLWWAGVAG